MGGGGCAQATAHWQVFSRTLARTSFILYIQSSSTYYDLYTRTRTQNCSMVRSLNAPPAARRKGLALATLREKTRLGLIHVSPGEERPCPCASLLERLPLTISLRERRRSPLPLCNEKTRGKPYPEGDKACPNSGWVPRRSSQGQAHALSEQHGGKALPLALSLGEIASSHLSEKEERRSPRPLCKEKTRGKPYSEGEGSRRRLALPSLVLPGG